MGMCFVINKVYFLRPFSSDITQRFILPGNESVAVVEYALYQKVPHEKRKADSKIGTIETGATTILENLLQYHSFFNIHRRRFYFIS
jgi:hypothetical protein